MEIKIWCQTRAITLPCKQNLPIYNTISQSPVSMSKQSFKFQEHSSKATHVRERKQRADGRMAGQINSQIDMQCIS